MASCIVQYFNVANSGFYRKCKPSVDDSVVKSNQLAMCVGERVDLEKEVLEEYYSHGK